MKKYKTGDFLVIPGWDWAFISWETSSSYLIGRRNRLSSTNLYPTVEYEWFRKEDVNYPIRPKGTPWGKNPNL